MHPAKELGLKKATIGKRQQHVDIKKLRRDMNIRERERKAEINSKVILKDLENRCRIRKKENINSHRRAETKARANAVKMKSYEQRINQYRHKREGSKWTKKKEKKCTEN